MTHTCFECGGIANEEHHVVPQSLGGTKTVWLCYDCHGKAHHMKRANIRQLTKEGLERAKANGVKIGRHPVMPPEIEEKVVWMREQGYTLREIADNLELKGHQPPNGGKRFYASTIKSIYDRCAS